jgi:hypothetical protein
MRALLMTAMMLCACLSLPGCTGADEEFFCEDEVTLTQYEWYECEFIGTDWTHLSIEMTSTGDSPVHVFTVKESAYDNWMNCGHSFSDPEFTGINSTGASMEGEIEKDHFYVLFDHPNSCDEEDASTPVVEISFKVVAS